MSLLSGGRESRSTKPVTEPIYNAGYVGSITPGELSDIKEGDRDRNTGARRCVFCRQAKPLVTGNGTTCDYYCETNEYAGIPWGKRYAHDKTDRGRQWHSL